MAYNPPPTGHVVIILDNGTTAMTGLQEHPGTGRRLNREPTRRLVFEELAQVIGIGNVHVVDPTKDIQGFERLVSDSLARAELTLIVARRPCLLSAKKLKGLEQAGKAGDGQPG
jgi:indolepyruvate ferredoxin oxidoreductase alpha subunit